MVLVVMVQLLVVMVQLLVLITNSITDNYFCRL